MTIKHLISALVFLNTWSAYSQEVPEEAPAPQRSLLSSAATREFNKPLYFDQIDNGLILPPLQLDYDLTLNEGKLLRMGNVGISEKTFFFTMQPLEKLHPQLSKVVGDDEGRKYTLIIAWPEKLLSHGVLEMISKSGEVIWKYKFSEADRKKWQDRLTSWRRSLLANGVPTKELGRTGLFGTQFGIVDLESVGAPFWNQRESFRFCLTQIQGRASTKMCSQRYGAKATGRNLSMGKVRSEATEPRVLVQNENAPLKKSMEVSTEVPTSFYAELASGESYEFVAVPNKLELMDIADTKNEGVLRIVGYGTRPVGNSTILNPDQSSALTKMLGFEATIGDPRKFWAAALKKEEARLFLPGQGGGVFKQNFNLSEIPRRQARVYLHEQTPSGTYIDGVKLKGRKQPVSKVTSEQNSVEEDSQDPTLFTWEFRTTERGKINRSYLEVEFEGKKYKSFYEIYKGYPRELSARMIAVQAASSFIIMGELAYNQWFENLLGWTNYYLGRQRWGFSGKVFQSINELDIDTAGGKAPLSVMTLDLKYRLSPGLWGRDESVGPLASYQDVTFGDLKAPMMGVGVFWARSMPRVFDDLFNKIPGLSYPKWVDMEFIYYINSMKSDVKLDSSMSLNFHGKVLWGERFFGEAGFGLKRYAFTDQTLNQQAELNTFYGTVGLGINF